MIDKGTPGILTNSLRYNLAQCYAKYMDLMGNQCADLVIL